MKIRFRWILAALAALPLISIGGGVFAAPMGVPQQMLPGYVPASPSRGVASFRPRYRSEPVWPMARSGQPGNVRPFHGPVRRAGNWPIPVSYRPMVPRPQPRFAPPYGYRGPVPRWTGYPLPVRGYGPQPMPRMAYGYPARPAVGVRGYPQARQFRPRSPYPPVVPARYRQPNWTMPRSTRMPPPYTGYPQRQAYPTRFLPVPPAMPGRFAGRYQPYAGLPGGRPDYRFRPMPQPQAYRGYPLTAGRPAVPAVPPNYRTWQGPGEAGPARRPAAPYQAWQMPDRPIRQAEVLAWENTVKRFPRVAY